MNEKEKLALLEDTFNMEQGALTPDMLLADVEEYDSMSKLSLIVMMDDTFGVKLDGAAVRSFQTVADILARMEK